MISRDINPTDAADGRALDVILDSNRQGNVQLSDDYIMVVESLPKLPPPADPIFSGVIVARPVMYMHEFRIDAGAMSRPVGESLIAHALMKGAMIGEREAIFVVANDNVKMQGFIEGHGAVRQPDGIMYSIRIPQKFYPRSPR